MSRRRGLGSGLDALIPGGQTGSTDAVRQIPVAAIRGNRSQPRTQFDETALDELAASISEHGIIQPIIVNETENGYELIAGERRWRAAQRAGLKELPALVKNATPQQLLELALVENVQRADLNPIEEGLAYQTLKEEFGLSDEVIGRRVGKSRVAVVNARRLIRLVPEARQALLAGKLTAGHGRALLRFDDASEQLAALRLVLEGEMSVRDAESLGELAQHALLSGKTRTYLLAGDISLQQTLALLQIEDKEKQAVLAEHVYSHAVGVAETERLATQIARGQTVEHAVAALTRGQAPEVEQSSTAARTVLGESRREATTQSPEDAEAQRLFEVLLETPVTLARTGGTIRLTITVYSDEQLQQLYERLQNEA